MKDSQKWFLSGLFVLILGVVTLTNAAVASMAIVGFTGFMLILAGLLQIGLGFWAERNKSKYLAWIGGALTLFLGWSFLAHPLAGVMSLTTVILFLFLIAGVAQIFFSFELKGTPYFMLVLGSGVLSLILAVVLLSSPAATMNLLGVLLGLQLLSGGSSLVGMGMFLRKNDP